VRVLFVLDQVDYEPQGIMQLSSVLKAAGHQVQLAICALEDPVRVALEFQPHILAYSVITGSQRYYLELNRRLRAKVNAFSAFGGPHPTFFPEMIQEEGVDGVCVGEGEGPLLDLAQALQPDGTLADTHLPNWHLKVGGEVIRNEVRPYVDLDSLPPPDYALVYDKDPVTRRSKIKHFIAGRGCPYGCTYCFNHALTAIYRGKGKPIRLRPATAVVDDVVQVRKDYPLEYVVFVDDTFVLDREWLQEFADQYRERVGLPFFCNVRANLVTPELVQLLRWAGCHSVSMGIEAGDDEVRNKLLNRNLSREQIVRAARLIREGGLRFSTTNMIGLPGTTIEDDFKTLDLNAEIRPDYAHAFIFQPYPRTRLGQYALENDMLQGTLDDIGTRAWERTILRFDPDHQRALTNLQRLFALGVEWPWLRPVLVRLLRLPSNPLYWLANKLWKGYAIKQRMHPVSMSARDLLSTAWRFMRIKS
jgi:anaerobic magnesium-protoporphyrin IX monomethyl ester cyclase